MRPDKQGGIAIGRMVHDCVGLLSRKQAAVDAFFRKQFRANSLSTWFLRALRSQDHLSRMGSDLPNGNYYEFGVGRGRTMMRYIKALRLYSRLSGVDLYSYSITGFDSFEGLPPKQSELDDYRGWSQGQFHHTLEEITALVGSQLDLGRSNVRFIKGFFLDSLTAELAQQLSSQRPSIVTIDVDYYRSTKIVLEWLAPIMPSGCLLYFDDLWAFYGHPEMGELGAINEFNRGGTGYLVPYTELGSTVGGRTYVFVRKEFEYNTRFAAAGASR